MRVFEDHMWKQKSDSTMRSKEKKIMVIASLFSCVGLKEKSIYHGKFYDFYKPNPIKERTSYFSISIRWNRYKGKRVHKIFNDHRKAFLKLYEENDY